MDNTSFFLFYFNINSNLISIKSHHITFLPFAFTMLTADQFSLLLLLHAYFELEENADTNIDLMEIFIQEAQVSLNVYLLSR
jgi:hypothetical protein